LDCVANGKKASPSFSEASYVQYVMEKAYESSKVGKIVNLNGGKSES
jgi:hypothetical protein